MTRLKNKKGFTLIELVMVIVILGILASVAVPKFTNLSGQARAAAEKGVVGGVKSGISLFAMNAVLAYSDSASMAGGNAQWPSGFPTALDTASDATASTTNPLFTRVLDQGGITTEWIKASNVYTGPSSGSAANYTYTAATGTFLQ